MPEINLRYGHRSRALAICGGRVLKRKILSRQRNHLLTMGPIHHHAQMAINNLLRFGHLDVLEPQLDENEIVQARAEEEGALNQIQDIFLMKMMILTVKMTIWSYVGVIAEIASDL